MLAKVNIQRPSQGEIDEGLKGREGGGGGRGTRTNTLGVSTTPEKAC